MYNIISEHVILVSTYSTAPSCRPQDIKVTSTDPAALTVSWQPPLEINCNGSITGYVIQYSRVESVDEMIVNFSNEAIPTIISELFSYVEYPITVAAANAYGIGHFSKPVVAISEDSELNLFYRHIRNTTGLGEFLH